MALQIDQTYVDYLASDQYQSDEMDREMQFGGRRLLRLLFEINFDQENRVRALEGKAAITKATYRDALLNIFKTL